MKQILLALIATLLNTQFLFSQINLISITDSNSFENNTEIDNDLRSIFLFSSIGFVDVISIGMGKQLNKNFSLSLKGTAAWVGSGYYTPNSGGGIGLKLSYHEKLLFLNTVSIEFTPFFQLNYYRPDKPISSPFKGYYFDINIGKEKVDESGFNFFWAIGFCVSAAKYEPLLYGPSLKIGLNFNFIKEKE